MNLSASFLIVARSKCSSHADSSTEVVVMLWHASWAQKLASCSWKSPTKANDWNWINCRPVIFPETSQPNSVFYNVGSCSDCSFSFTSRKIHILFRSADDVETWFWEVRVSAMDEDSKTSLVGVLIDGPIPWTDKYTGGLWKWLENVFRHQALLGTRQNDCWLSTSFLRGGGCIVSGGSNLEAWIEAVEQKI